MAPEAVCPVMQTFYKSMQYASGCAASSSSYFGQQLRQFNESRHQCLRADPCVYSERHRSDMALEAQDGSSLEPAADDDTGEIACFPSKSSVGKAFLFSA